MKALFVLAPLILLVSGQRIDEVAQDGQKLEITVLLPANAAVEAAAPGMKQALESSALILCTISKEIQGKTLRVAYAIPGVLIDDQVYTSAGLIEGVRTITMAADDRGGQTRLQVWNENSKDKGLAISKLQELPTGKSSAKLWEGTPQIGQEVIVTGCPGGALGVSKTTIFSLVEDYVVIEKGMGYEGGGVFTTSGELIGVVQFLTSGIGDSNVACVRRIRK